MSGARIVDLSDEQLRARGGLKWTYPPPDVLPAWVAETDVAPDPIISRAVADVVARGDFGYPPADVATGLPQSLANYARRQWGWDLAASSVILTADVMCGIALALRYLCDDTPVVVPTPTYPPFLDVARLAGLDTRTVPLDPDAERAALDLDAIDAALRAGARTVLLCNPHNPWGRAFTRSELEGLRDVALARGARVVSDEIHAGLVLPGAHHIPFATLEGASEITTTVVSASKAWNLPALKCAQVVTGTPADARTLRTLPMVANHGTSHLGITAAVAAYDGGQPWLDAFVGRLEEVRALFGTLLAERLPDVRARPLEATYLAWLDVRSYGHDDPARVVLEQGRLMVSDGRNFGPGGQGHVRVNLGTSLERVERIVDALASGLKRRAR